jgi:hypothetical protein
VAEEGEALESTCLREPVDIAGEDLEAERRRVDPFAPPLAALVHVKHAALVTERVEPGPEVCVVEARPAVEDDQRDALAAPDLFDEQRVAVSEADVQLLASCQSSPTPMSTASGGSRS